MNDKNKFYLNKGNLRRTNLIFPIDKGNKIPEKGNIVILFGAKGEDVIFMDNLSIVDERIYMKLSDLR